MSSYSHSISLPLALALASSNDARYEYCVTKWRLYAPSRAVNAPSRAVTRRHVPSRAVTRPYVRRFALRDVCRRRAQRQEP
eukprot:CAMPEP_0181228050 /NCGR_PEP_ID=MMETSP1096-20121128/33134_1 /TAXON_ID=156174 ORGANISM="Chrysochromulina ericina, Strain CCMP281" /NCGR_SAMPLE_ID=MMETSP1096 /ASSEMBLY_ACC=CAM_ASM_000453 /LENGTH=80 /DNA_ID=CAMNT_0023321535 /DNA_START=111 /DNA_END=353 /DNA_ORIENTATION=+